MCKNKQEHFGPMVISVCLHITLPQYHHYVDLSEGIELLKCFSDMFCLQCVSKIKSILSCIFHAIYGAVCIQFTHYSYDDCEKMCTLSYYHHQIGSMTHLPLLNVRSWNNGMLCMSFYILMATWILIMHHFHIFYITTACCMRLYFELILAQPVSLEQFKHKSYPYKTLGIR